MSADELRRQFALSISGTTSALTAADRLCQACVELLDVDGASISVTQGGTTRGTFGSSGVLSRRVDEYQFTFGEGPCLDAVRDGAPVLVADLAARTEQRWPAFRGAALESGVRAVFALPVSWASSSLGALDLYNHETGPLTGHSLAGGLLAARLAALPLLDMMSSRGDLHAHAETEDGWDQLASLERVEVYQATGMIIAALDVSPAEALVRLRANAYARDMTATELAWDILERRIDLSDDEPWAGIGDNGGGDS